ncbi:CocE/NonD family hydrolase C-terminal non-catalytic domain-containing protein [Aquihabitans daechungensis]|uniref:CocE/NonD family hydrolase C-terminal non-catalytic domain-containing protein n=1 Tax=Aquihabitans daechungensis TaxID=1052257 RepID=UPI003BA12892
MNEFIDHYLDPERTPDAPTFDVGASVTRCLPVDQEQTYLVADRWGELSNATVELDRADADFEPVTLSTTEAGPSGAATDPISTATLPGPNSFKGCRIVRPAKADPTTATVDFPVARTETMVGAPTVHVDVSTHGPDVPLAVRVWDVLPDGSAQALVTRGVYRMTDAAPTGTDVTFQLWPQAYRFTAGHQIRVEVTPNDAPYLLANTERVAVDVHDIALDLPVHREPAPEPESEPEPVPEDGSGGPTIALVGLGALILIGLVVVAAVQTAGRRSRRTTSSDE